MAQLTNTQHSRRKQWIMNSPLVYYLGSCFKHLEHLKLNKYYIYIQTEITFVYQNIISDKWYCTIASFSRISRTEKITGKSWNKTLKRLHVLPAKSPMYGLHEFFFQVNKLLTFVIDYWACLDLFACSLYIFILLTYVYL